MIGEPLCGPWDVQCSRRLAHGVGGQIFLETEDSEQAASQPLLVREFARDVGARAYSVADAFTLDGRLRPTLATIRG